MEGLKKAATFLRGEIGRRLGLRRAPEILFRLDQGIEESVHIQHLIRSLDPDGRDE
ncbi:MAG: ribosome-binding factor A [Thermaerobacter sp.]|nr:ribosome-binding factor A [Thermaerobacter sp.]